MSSEFVTSSPEDFNSKLAKARKIAHKINEQLKKSDPTSENVISILGDRPDLKIRRKMSTGNPVVDKVLGGGLTLGVPVIIQGNPGLGKTSLACSIARQFIKANKLVAYVNVEQQDIPIDQLRIAGGFTDEELDKLIIIPAFGSGENLFDVIKEFLLDPVTLKPVRLVECVIIDSIAALAPAGEVKSISKNGFEGVTVGEHARMVSKFLRQMCGTGALSREGSLIMINQLRTKVSTSGGHSPDIGTGGKAPLYYAKTILSLKKNTEVSKTLVENGEQTGLAIDVEVIKNNAGIPGKIGTFQYVYGIGLDYFNPIYQEALEYGIINKLSTVSYEYIDLKGDAHKMRGADAMKSFIRETYSEELTTRVEEYRTKTSVVPTEMVTADLLDSVEEEILGEAE